MFTKSSYFSSSPDKVLLCHPQWFEVIDEKNVHMEGQIGKIDKAKAVLQWEKLVEIYKKISKEGLLSEVSILPGVKGLEDMVFAANQTFPFLDREGKRKVILSQMKHPNRQKEVSYYQVFFEEKGYEVLHLPQGFLFEGMGDLLVIPDTQKCLCGFGFRTDQSTIAYLRLLTQYEIVELELVNPSFYHLDTCISIIDTTTALYVPSAFSSSSIEQLKLLFVKCIAVSEHEASEGFALNMHVLGNKEKKWAILQEDNKETEAILRELGLEVIPLDTSEYIKSGGSVFCMKMMYY